MEEEFQQNFKDKFIPKCDTLIMELQRDEYPDISHYQQKLIMVWGSTIIEICNERGLNPEQLVITQSPIHLSKISLQKVMRFETFNIFQEQSNRIFMT